MAEKNMSLKKCPMPSLDPNYRNKVFEEVATGYTYEMADRRGAPLPALQEQALRKPRARFALIFPRLSNALPTRISRARSRF